MNFFVMPRAMPRDTRDTLFQLLVIGWVILPHLLHLPAWCSLMAGAVLLWRARLAWAAGPLPSRWWVTGLLAVATGLTVWGERALLGKEAGVTMLVVLLTLKTLELRARRDALVVFFLGFFLVLTNFLYSQSLGTGLWMLAAVWGLLTALVLAHMPVGRPPLARAGVVAGRAALLGVPVMVVLFLLFPRIGPLWGLPQDAAGRTGLSGSMRLGGLAEVANDDSIALRLRFFGAVPTPEQLYFRGPVLSTFDGREWTRLVPSTPVAQRARAELELLGAPLRYEMTLEPSRLPLLPLLEMTPEREDAAPRLAGWLFTLRPDAQWQADRPISERLRIEASAWPSHRHGPRAAVPGLRDLVQLPADFNPRTLAWAAQLRARPEYARADARTLAQAVLRHIGSAGYTYTLQPGTYGRDAVDEFWFDRKLGFCEHFAAAFVVVMRALDVPARIVTGYQGTDAQPQDGYWVVRQSNAHAWAEYWQAGAGWVRVDPTAAVAPGRVQRGGSLRPPPGLVAGAMGSLDPALAARLREGWEVMNNRWNQWVLNYSRKQQFSLLESLGIKSPSWQDLATTLILLLCAAALLGAGWAWWDRRRQDPWQRLQRRVLERLAALGVPVLPHHPPRERAARVRARLGARGETLAQVLEALDRQRYAGATAAGSARGWWPRFAAAARATAALAACLLLTLGTPDAEAAEATEATEATEVAKVAEATEVAKVAHKRKALRPSRAAIPAAAAAALAYGKRPDVMQFAAELAQRRGLDPEWVLRQLGQARRLAAVQRLVMPPPAGSTKNWLAYRSRFIEPGRIDAGLAFWAEHQAWLAEAEQRFGVPAEIVVAIIGVETFYGRVTGGFRVIDALATLAFDFPAGRKDRSAFFRGELEELLVLAQREGVDALALKGSFAGAMGLPQFMPGSINRYALDFDGDGRIDLQRSAADAVGSVAHFLAEHGWQRGLATHYGVAAPEDAGARATLLGPDIRPSFSAAQFSAQGAQLDAAGLAYEGPLALVELQNGNLAPSYVAGTQNFYALTRYNWSSYYALAVITLAEELRRSR